VPFPDWRCSTCGGRSTRPRGSRWRAELEEAGKKFLIDRVSTIAPSPQVPLIPLVAEGDPAEALVVAAEDADMLVVGSRDRSPIVGAVLGAVSLRVAAGAHCPVTFIKAPAEDPDKP
jgi:nucleotide-binding universal stress UspA family protein